jgi:hypothetical protein
LQDVRGRDVSKLSTSVSPQHRANAECTNATHHGRQRAEYGEDADAEVGHGMQLVDLALLELFFWQRQKAEIRPWLLR